MYQQFKNQLNKNPWNNGKLMGQKPPLAPQEICAISGINGGDRPVTVAIQLFKRFI